MENFGRHLWNDDTFQFTWQPTLPNVFLNIVNLQPSFFYFRFVCSQLEEKLKCQIVLPEQINQKEKRKTEWGLFKNHHHQGQGHSELILRVEGNTNRLSRCPKWLKLIILQIDDGPQGGLSLPPSRSPSEVGLGASSSI